jgi:hypothetical protein
MSRRIPPERYIEGRGTPWRMSGRIWRLGSLSLLSMDRSTPKWICEAMSSAGDWIVSPARHTGRIDGHPGHLPWMIESTRGITAGTGLSLESAPPHRAGTGGQVSPERRARQAVRLDEWSPARLHPTCRQFGTIHRSGVSL